MGYGYHITRRQHWAREEAAPITPSERLTLVDRTREELCPVSDGVARLPPDWHSHVWRRHPERPTGVPVFSLRAGNLDFSNDDPATMSFAVRLAESLHARVVGDEGEVYSISDIIGRAGDVSYNPRNPLTGEPLYFDGKGLVEVDATELQFVVRRRALFGLRKTEERLLLHFVLPSPAAVSGLDGVERRLRGRVSRAGSYGASGSCSRVLYVLHMVDDASASE